jgi:hypothetical protein
MAMIPRLWSISALAVELEVDRRTMAAALKGVAPDGKEGRHDAWRLTTALTALGWGPGAAIVDGESYLDARTRWMRARAETAQHEAAKAAREAAVHAGELVAVGPASEARTKQVKMMSDRMLQIPTRAVPLLLAAKDGPRMHAVLKDLIHEGLEAIANCEIKMPADAAGKQPVAGRGAAGRAPRGKATTEVVDQ